MEPQKQDKTTQAGLFIPNRELSWAVSLALILSFLMFCAGYFWGQRKAVAQFLHKVKEESFADSITYSFYALSPQQSVDEDATEEQETDETETAEPQPVQLADSGTAQQPLVSQENKTIENKTVPQRVYVAPLVGFGTLHAAQKFEERVKKLEIPVMVKQRSSTTQNGKKIVWYQAITQEYEDKKELERVIDLIKEKEKIKEVKIIEKKKG